MSKTTKAILLCGLLIPGLVLAENQPSYQEIKCPEIASVTIRNMGSGVYKWQTQYQWADFVGSIVYGGGGSKAIKLLPRAGVTEGEIPSSTKLWCIYQTDPYENLAKFDLPKKVELTKEEGILIAHALNTKCTVAEDNISFKCSPVNNRHK